MGNPFKKQPKNQRLKKWRLDKQMSMNAKSKRNRLRDWESNLVQRKKQRQSMDRERARESGIGKGSQGLRPNRRNQGFWIQNTKQNYRCQSNGSFMDGLVAFFLFNYPLFIIFSGHKLGLGFNFGPWWVVIGWIGMA